MKERKGTGETAPKEISGYGFGLTGGSQGEYGGWKTSERGNVPDRYSVSMSVGVSSQAN